MRFSPGCQCCETPGVECPNCDSSGAWNMELTITGFANSGSEDCTPCTDYNVTIELTPSNLSPSCRWELTGIGTCFDSAIVDLDVGGTLTGTLLGKPGCGFGTPGYVFTVNVGTPPVDCQAFNETGLSVTADLQAINCGACDVSGAAVAILSVEP